MIENSLVMKFNDTNKGSLTITIKDCIQDIEESVVSEDMDAIVDLNVLQQNNSAATASSRSEAFLISKETTELYI